MAIKTKTELQNIFVTNAVPTQQNYTDWIDSCVFLEDANSSQINYLTMEQLVAPSNPDAGDQVLFLNSADENRLTLLDSSGNAVRVQQNKYINVPLRSAFLSTERPALQFITKRAITIKSARVCTIGVGSYAVSVESAPVTGSVTGTIPIVASVAVSSPSGTDYLEQVLTLAASTVAVNRVIRVDASTFSGTFESVLTIEYSEV